MILNTPQYSEDELKTMFPDIDFTKYKRISIRKLL